MTEGFSPAEPGTKCGKSTMRGFRRFLCDAPAVCTQTTRGETRHTCAKHAPKAWHPAIEARYALRESTRGPERFKIVEVPIIKRTEKQVTLRESMPVTGYRLVMPATDYDATFDASPVEAVEAAHRQAVRLVEQARARLAEAEQHEADVIAFLAAMPGEVSRA